MQPLAPISDCLAPPAIWTKRGTSRCASLGRGQRWARPPGRNIWRRRRKTAVASLPDARRLKHERLLLPPSPWNSHAETINGTVLVSTPPGCKRKHGDVTSLNHVCSCLLTAPLATTPGQPVPHHRRCWVLGWQIRCVAVSRDATVRHPGLGSLPSSQVRLVGPWQLLHLHDHRLRLCFTIEGGDYDRDLLMFTSNPILLRFLIARQVARINAARAHVEGLVEQSNPTRLRSVMRFRQHCLLYIFSQ